MTKSVRSLLNKIHPDSLSGPKVRLSTTRCISDFLAHLHFLESRHCKKKIYSNDYLVSNVFHRVGYFQRDSEVSAYCRINLYVAIRQFEKLFQQMKNDQNIITTTIFRQYKSTIYDYLHDIRPIAEYLEQKKNKDYSFFNGDKYYGMMAWQIFAASRQLAAMTLNESVRLNYRASHVAAIFMLRQALEAKFDMLINVSLVNKAGQTPKVKHDFHYSFIKNNLNYYEFTSVNFLLLERIYVWCNTIVHKAIQPLIWQSTYALEISEGLFAHGPLNSEGGWSINGGVRISDVESMQNSFVEYFIGKYEHGIWCIEPLTPEAVCNFKKSK